MRRLISLILLIAVAVAIFIGLKSRGFLSLETLQMQLALYRLQLEVDPTPAVLGFMTLYVLVTALSIPAATPLTLIAGASFGLWKGVLLVSFASTLGATIALILSRTLLGDWVRSRFALQIQSIEQGLKRDGALYLLSLRLLPLIPFWLVNLAFGMTSFSILRFAIISQLGMLPGTVIYVNAGRALGELTSFNQIASPALLASLTALALLPWMSRFLYERVRAFALYRPYERPRSFDANVVVIGAGSGGLVSAYLAAASKAKVFLVERGEMGGDCLNTGCVPSKALIRIAKRARTGGATQSWDWIQAEIKRVIQAIAPHDSEARYRALGVDVLRGEAKILDPFRVQVGAQIITTRSIVVATGARPRLPDVPGVSDVALHTSDTIWSLTSQPKSMLIFGAGAIGCELGQAFARLGTKVTLIERSDRILPREPKAVSETLHAALTRDGVEILTHATLVELKKDGAVPLALIQFNGGPRMDQSVTLSAEVLLSALGREPRRTSTDFDFGAIDPETLTTRYPNITVCGDVSGHPPFTHSAAAQAWPAMMNALFGGLKRFRFNPDSIPAVTFTDPEVASAGLSEQALHKKGVAFETTRYDLNDLDRAIIEHEDGEKGILGFIEVRTPPGKDRILGVTWVGAHAGEGISAWIIAIQKKLGLRTFVRSVMPYPTHAEASKYVAGVWQKNHLPHTALNVLAKIHRWRLGR